MTTKEEAVWKAELEFSYLEGILKRSGIDYDEGLDTKMNKLDPYSITMQKGIDFLLDDKWGNRIRTYGPQDQRPAYAQRMYELSEKTACKILKEGENTKTAQYVSDKIMKIADSFMDSAYVETQHLRAA